MSAQKIRTEPVRAKIKFQKIRTEPKRANKKLDRAGPSQKLANTKTGLRQNIGKMKAKYSYILLSGNAWNSWNPNSPKKISFNYISGLLFGLLNGYFIEFSGILWLVIGSRADELWDFWTGPVRANFHEPKPSQNWSTSQDELAKNRLGPSWSEPARGSTQA